LALTFYHGFYSTPTTSSYTGSATIKKRIGKITLF